MPFAICHLPLLLLCELELRVWLYNRAHPLRAIRAYSQLCQYVASRPNTAPFN